jgi:predicted metal-dependent phosphoesterase TrpH
MTRSSHHDLKPSLVAHRRPPGGALIELHSHSVELSLDSGASAASLIARAKSSGLDAICLTEHNALWEPIDLRELAERYEFPVFAGMELGTDAGHVLAFGFDRYRPELLVIERLRQIAATEGAVLVLAHPMRPFHGVLPPWSEFPRWFEGVEVINGDHSDTEDGYLVRQVADLGLAATGGSDAHTREAVGRVTTAFPQRIRGVEDIMTAIRLAETRPIDFRPRSLAGGV